MAPSARGQRKEMVEKTEQEERGAEPYDAHRCPEGDLFPTCHDHSLSKIDVIDKRYTIVVDGARSW